MIDPQSLDVSALPYVLIKNTSLMPCVAAVYFCATHKGEIFYIGETSNLYKRWGLRQHDKLAICKGCGCDRVYWLELAPSDRYDRLPIERSFIRFYRPIFNTQLRNGKSIDAKIAPLPLEQYPRSLKAICEAVGMSQMNWYRVESEKQSLPEVTLRKIEQVLGVDFGVKFND